MLTSVAAPTLLTVPAIFFFGSHEDDLRVQAYISWLFVAAGTEAVAITWALAIVTFGLRASAQLRLCGTAALGGLTGSLFALLLAGMSNSLTSNYATPLVLLISATWIATAGMASTIMLSAGPPRTWRDVGPLRPDHDTPAP